MKRIYHPEFPGITQEVPDADVKDWKDAGWRLTKPDGPVPDEPVDPPVPGPEQTDAEPEKA